MINIELKDITKIYNNNFTAVENISFKINDGEFFVLVGPSGCGKSTILKLIAGLEEISKGELLFNNKIINNVAPKDRNIGMVFQNYALYPHLNIYDNLAFPLKINKISKNEIKSSVENIASLLGLKDSLNKKPKHLSGGQRQRVALGRAIIKKPDVFLFDEPLSNLDAKLRVQMRTEIIKLHRTYLATSIYVTHDQTEAMTMADKILLLNEGKIVQIGSPSELYKKPTNLFAASFLGSPQINFFKGELTNQNIFQAQDFNITLKDNFNLNGKCTLAIRPEDILITNEETSDIKTKIINIEYMGFETIIYFELEGLKSIRINNSDYVKYNTNDYIFLKLQKDNILIFDSNENRINPINNF